MTRGLIDDLVEARADFLTALERIDPSRLDAPGLTGKWSARELVAHLGYWAGHVAEVIHAVEGNRVEEIDDGDGSVDERNETVARVARQAALTTVRKREAASVQALLERLADLDPAHLSERLPDGVTLEEKIREDGAVHYREHLSDLRSALGPS